MNRENIVFELRNLAEEEYKNFNLKLIPTKKEMLGVRLPALRSLAKKIAKSDWQGFLKESKNDIYEELMLQGLVIAYAKIDFSEKLTYTKDFVAKIDNWAICDCFCGTMKDVKKHQKEFLNFLEQYFDSEQEFELRFIAVMLMNYYIDEQYIDYVLKKYDEIQSDKYYVNMAVAWGISVCFVKFPEKTMAYLKDNNLDDFTYNKALQKIIESLRVDKETKNVIRTMKRK